MTREWFLRNNDNSKEILEINDESDNEGDDAKKETDKKREEECHGRNRRLKWYFFSEYGGTFSRSTYRRLIGGR